VRIGILHPGEMGAVVGAALVSVGHEVAWASELRSAETKERAVAASLDDVGTLGALAESVELILCVCPPHAAGDVATAVVAAGFTGLYVDANAVAPATARDLTRIVEDAGAAYVDGSIIGPPPRAPGSTRLFLSGQRAAEIEACFAGTPLQTVVLTSSPVAASAVKMSYAAYAKGTQALLVAVRALAQTNDVDDAMLDEWALSIPDLAARSEQARHAAATKGWRWEGEMREIARTFADADLPSGFHEAAAEIFHRYGRI
jgi:3-hydroxyisobutyrate dehydrogenase-like beta-hydroxyacid dehydrogenase